MTAEEHKLSLPALAARAQLGDRAALEQLLSDLQPQLLAHIRGIVRDDDAAADVLQESLTLLYRRLKTLRDTNWVRAWSYRIATREAVRAAARSRHEVDLRDDDTALGEIPREALETDDDLIAELMSRLSDVPVAAQAVLRMHYLHSLSQQEIAEALEIPVGTVKSRLSYGLGFLRKRWVRA